MTDRRKSPVEEENIDALVCTIDLRPEILGRLPFFKGCPRRPSALAVPGLHPRLQVLMLLNSERVNQLVGRKRQFSAVQA